MKSAQNLNPPKLWPACMEIAATNAYESVYPSAHMKACLFHMSQALYRKIQQFPAINRQYKSDATYARNIRMIPALAFLPPQDVEYGFETLEHSDFFEKNAEDLADFLNYFENNYIGQITASQRRAPKFAIR